MLRELSRTILVATVFLTAATLSAQQQSQSNQYAGNETRLLGRAYLYQARAGLAPRFESGVKRHMAWHKLQKDPWSWETWEIATGPSAGQYLIVTMPAWSELASWDAHFAAGQAADAAANIVPYSDFQGVFYWIYRDDLSRPTPGSLGMLPKTWANPAGAGDEVAQDTRGNRGQALLTPVNMNMNAGDLRANQSTRVGANLGYFYAASTGYPMVQLVNYQIKPEAQADFVGAVRKIRDAMVKTNWQPKQGYFWYELGAGGDEPQITLLLPKTSWTEVTSPTGQMAEAGGLFSGVLEAAYGKAEADAVLQTMGRSIQRKWTDVVVKRNDLSYTSPKSKLMFGGTATGIQ